MIKKLYETLLNTAVYHAIRKEYANEDEAYLLYLISKKVTNTSIKAKETKAA